ncbi:MAG: hypothetical protein KGZ25_02655 [Planctomycetes bacterium]|nr:hypothetical protein [Planctomycetota bacterium]
MGSYGSPNGDGGGNKMLWGCCGGCAGLLAIIMVVGGAFIYSFARPRPEVRPETFLTSEADAFAIGRISPDDEWVKAPLKKFAENPPESLELDESAKKQLKEHSGEFHKNLGHFSPAQFVLLVKHKGKVTASEKEDKKASSAESAEKSAESEEVGKPKTASDQEPFDKAVVFSVWPQRFMGRLMVGFVRLVVNKSIGKTPEQNGEIVKHNGLKIAVTKKGKAFSQKGNNFMMSDDPETIKTWHDQLVARLKAKDKDKFEYSGPANLKWMYGQLDPEAPIVFASTNKHGEIKRFLTSVKQMKSSGDNKEAQEKLKKAAEHLLGTRIVSNNVESVGGQAQLVDPDTVRVEFYCKCHGKEFAKGLSEDLQKAFKAATEDWKSTNVDASRTNTLVKIKIVKQGFQKALQKALEKSQKESQ